MRALLALLAAVLAGALLAWGAGGPGEEPASAPAADEEAPREFVPKIQARRPSNYA